MNSLITAEQGITGNFAAPATRRQLSPRKNRSQSRSDLYDTNTSINVRLFDGGTRPHQGRRFAVVHIAGNRATSPPVMPILCRTSRWAATCSHRIAPDPVEAFLGHVKRDDDVRMVAVVFLCRIFWRGRHAIALGGIVIDQIGDPEHPARAMNWPSLLSGMAENSSTAMGR
jgi:hypothetical protein